MKFFDYFVAVPRRYPAKFLFGEFVGSCFDVFFSAHLMPSDKQFPLLPDRHRLLWMNFQDRINGRLHRLNYIIFQDEGMQKHWVELYLQDKDLCLRLSAALLYSFSNLTLGNPSASRMGFRNIQECLLLAKEKFCTKRNHGFLCFCQLSWQWY